MAWTTPRTWVASETVTAAIMNTHIRDNLNALVRSTNAGSNSPSTTTSNLLQSGTGTISLSAAVTGTSAVTFGTAYSNAPIVTITGSSTTTGGLNLVYAIDASTNSGVPTTTGFTARATSQLGGTLTATARFSWIAIGT